jgi:hypothetical protein
MLFALLITLLFVITTWILIRVGFHLFRYAEQMARGNSPILFRSVKTCERCNTELPRFSKKVSAKQLFIGGWTCPHCGSEFDQLNNVTVARAFGAHLRDSKTPRLDRTENWNDKSPIERVFDE